MSYKPLIVSKQFVHNLHKYNVDDSAEVIKELFKPIMFLQEHLPTIKDFNIYELRAFILILKFVSRKQFQEGRTQEINLYNETFKELFSYSTRSAYDNALSIVEKFRNLPGKSVNGDEITIYNLLKSFTYNPKTKSIKLVLTEDFLNLLLGDKDKTLVRYGKFFLSEILGLTSSYSLKLFLYLSVKAHDAYLRVCDGELTLRLSNKELRDILDIKDKYADEKILRYKVLQKVLKEINETTNFTVVFFEEIPKQRRKKDEDYVFSVSKKFTEKDRKRLLKQINATSEDKELTEEPKWLFRNPDEVGIEEFEEDTSL